MRRVRPQHLVLLLDRIVLWVESDPTLSAIFPAGAHCLDERQESLSATLVASVRILPLNARVSAVIVIVVGAVVAVVDRRVVEGDQRGGIRRFRAGPEIDTVPAGPAVLSELLLQLAMNTYPCSIGVPSRFTFARSVLTLNVIWPPGAGPLEHRSNPCLTE